MLGIFNIFDHKICCLKLFHFYLECRKYDAIKKTLHSMYVHSYLKKRKSFKIT